MGVLQNGIRVLILVRSFIRVLSNDINYYQICLTSFFRYFLLFRFS